jgi:hypothetical protein
MSCSRCGCSKSTRYYKTKRCGHSYCEKCLVLFESGFCVIEPCVQKCPIRVSEESAPLILESCKEAKKQVELALIDKIDRLRDRMQDEINFVQGPYLYKIEKAEKKAKEAAREYDIIELMTKEGLRMSASCLTSPTYLTSKMQRASDVCRHRLADTSVILRYDYSERQSDINFSGKYEFTIHSKNEARHFYKARCTAEIIKKTLDAVFVRVLPRKNLAIDGVAESCLSERYLVINELNGVLQGEFTHPYHSKNWKVADDGCTLVASSKKKSCGYSISRGLQFYTIKNKTTKESVTVFCDTHSKQSEANVYADKRYVRVIFNKVDEYVLPRF